MHTAMNNIFHDLKNIKERWASINMGEVNGTPVAVRVMEDVEAEFHTHEQADEFFMVLSGKIFIDTEHASIELNEGEYKPNKAPFYRLVPAPRRRRHLRAALAAAH